jgi:two-component system response regulator PilR (NtrC family)
VTRPVLIVEDEQSIRDILAELFDAEGTAVTAAATLEEARAALAATEFHLIVTDLRLGGRRDGGLQVMAVAGLLAPDATVVVLTAYPDEDNRHASLRLGATHFLEKPVDLQTIAGLAADAGVATAMRPGPFLVRDRRSDRAAARPARGGHPLRPEPAT